MPAQGIHFEKEELGHVGGKHALVVLGKDAVVETAFGELPVQKPKPEQIVTELFTKEPFTADAVKGGEHAGLEQLFGRNAGAAVVGIEIVKQRGELFQDDVHLAFDGAQRMIRRHALVEIDDRQKVRLGLEFSTHELQTNFPFASSNVFQQTASRPFKNGTFSGS